MPNRSPELILFDLGDVVCQFLPQRRLDALSEATGLSTTELYERLWESGLTSAFDRGEYPRAEMVAAINTAIGVDLPDADLTDIWCLAFETNHEVVARAREMRTDHRVGMLTNNPPLLFETIPTHFPEIAKTFEPILFSSVFGVRKPDPAIFRAVEEHLGLAPEMLMLIDDSPANVDAARARGWRGVVFEGVESLDFREGLGAG